MSPRVFPIKTQTACQLKWSWSTLRLYTGSTSSCHRVLPDHISLDNFESFHNTPKKLADRQLMLQGQWPQGGCEYCRDIEQQGGFSDRKLHLLNTDLAPPELGQDSTAVDVTPTIVEVYFDNVCNLKCLYCWDGFSSKIQQENRKFGRFEQHGVVIDNRARPVDNLDALTQEFWHWMHVNVKHLRRFHFLGGEPFYQAQLDQALDFFDQQPAPDLEFNIISNLMVDPERFANRILQIKNLIAKRKLKRFDITASIDCFGPAQEYVRSGLDLDTWRENFEFLVGQRWITLHINQTFSVLTMKTAAEMLAWVFAFRKQRRIGHFFGTVEFTQDFFYPGIFGPGFFDKDFESMYNTMSDNDQSVLQYLKGLQATINAQPRDQTKIMQLGVYLNEMDRRRGTDWRSTFPWLVPEVDHVVQ